MAGLARWWSRLSPNARLVVGLVIICLVGLAGLTPKTVLGMTIPWPYAALWGAAGWGAAGMSFRPMIFLALLGVAQDVASNAPIGAFMLVNLAAYGASATMAEAFDIEGDLGARAAAPALSIGAGFFTLWLIASGTADHAVRVGPILGAFVVTLGAYYLAARAFWIGGDLQGRRA
ncbi:MAG: hypothetical protein AAFX08_10080 [Pseudomonadota bacterium]